MASEPGGQVPGSGVCVNSSDDTGSTASRDAGRDVGETETVDTDIELASEDQGSGEVLGAGADISGNDFSTKSWKEDLTLIVEGKQLHVSSSMLAYMSPVFSAMFDEKFSKDGPREIELSEHQYPDFLEFLRCIYPTVKKRVTLENVFLVLPLVKIYKVAETSKQCENVLVDHLDEDQTPRNICRLAREASSYSMKLLGEKCMKLAATLNRKDLIEAEREYPLPLDMKVEVQSGNIVSLCDKVESLQTTLKESQSQSESRYKLLEGRNRDLEEIVKALWSDDGGRLNMRDNKIGILRLTLKKSESLKRTVSSPVDLNGLRWTVIADIKTISTGQGTQFFVKTDYLEITLNSKAINQAKDWSCQVEAAMRILKRDSSNTHLWKRSSRTVKASDSQVHFQKIMRMTQLWSYEFARKNEVEIEVFIIAKDLFTTTKLIIP